MATMKTILLVDDEPKIRELARDYLEHAGFAVQTAGDGRAALAACPRPATGSRRPRPGPARGRRPRGHPDAPARLGEPIVVLTARDDEIGQAARAQARRRRLRDEAVQSRASSSPGSRRSPRSRAGRTSPATVVRAGDVTLDLPRMRVDVNGRAGRAHPDRVPAAGDARPPARPDLHSEPAARCAAGRRLRVVRAGDRHPT